MVSSSSGPGTEPEFMTVAEVATRMRVSKMTVYRLLHGGEVPAARVGRSFRVREEDVDVTLWAEVRELANESALSTAHSAVACSSASSSRSQRSG